MVYLVVIGQHRFLQQILSMRTFETVGESKSMRSMKTVSHSMNIKIHEEDHR